MDRLDKELEYEKKQTVLAEGARLKATQQVEGLVKENEELRDQVFEVKKSNHILKMELKGTSFYPTSSL